MENVKKYLELGDEFFTSSNKLIESIKEFTFHLENPFKETLFEDKLRALNMSLANFNISLKELSDFGNDKKESSKQVNRKSFFSIEEIEAIKNDVSHVFKWATLCDEEDQVRMRILQKIQENQFKK